MLRMDLVHVVRHKVLVEGRTQRAVARELGLSRTTVGKYVDQAAPARKVEAAPRPRPVWDAIAERVQAVLADSVRWTGGKQRLTATRLHALLLGEGHRVGGTVVKDAVAEWKRQRREVCVAPTYRAGEPAGVTRASINATLLAQMDARLDTQRDATGATIGMRFVEEQRHCRRAPTPFAPEATTFATVSPRALVRLEGTVYSVPSRWAGLDLVVRIGATTVTIVGRDGTRILHPRKRFGQRSIDYRHYLSELARKPQAVRQVLPDLLRDLGDPFPAIWDQLHGAHGPREAARLFAKVLGELDTYGAAIAVPALTRALATGTPLLLALTPARWAPTPVALDAVPIALRDIAVPSGCAADYDAWLLGGAA